MTPAARAATVGLGAIIARAALGPSWRASSIRLNHRGHAVSLGGGPALTAGATASAAVGALADRRPGLAAAVVVAGLGAGAAGYYDDALSDRPDQKVVKGLAGHLGALRQGRVTAGVVKLAGLGAAGLVAAALLPGLPRGRSRWARSAHLALGAGVIAGTANAINLLDLRPGRALKAGVALGVPLATGQAGSALGGPVGAAAALLAEDLDEQIMLGDCGANALGALLGVGLAARTGLAGRAVALAALAAVTLASEKVSFSAVIDATPGLRALDLAGRRRPPRRAE